MATTTANETLAQQGERFYAEALEYMEQHSCRWSEACFQIKRRHPEAREAMQAASVAQRRRRAEV